MYIAVLEEEYRISTSSSLLLTRLQRIYDLKDREKHKPVIRKISNDDMDDPYGGWPKELDVRTNVWIRTPQIKETVEERWKL